MGDKELEINYTPEELEEIERIVGVIDQIGQAQDVEVPEEEAAAPTVEDGFFIEEPEDESFGEPEDLDLPVSELEEEEEGEFPAEEFPDIDLEQPEEITREEDLPEIPIDDITEIIDEPAEEEFPDLEEIDVTPVEEEAPAEEIPEEAEFEEISLDTEELADLGDLGDLSEEFPEDEPESAGDEFDTGIDLEEMGEPAGEPDILSDFDAGAEETGEKSSLEQLDELTEGESESLDIQDLADQEFVDDTSLPSLDDIMAEEPVEPAIDQEVSLEGDETAEIPDLSDLDIEEAGELPEAIDSDIPDIDLGDTGLGTELDTSFGETVEEPVEEAGSLDSGDELDQFGDISDMGGAFDDLNSLGDESTPMDELGEGITEIDLAEQADSPDQDSGVFDEEAFEIEPLDEEGPEAFDVPPQAQESRDQTSGIELSDRELNSLKKAMMLFNPAIRQAVKDTVINDLLPVPEIRQLVDMILSGKPEHSIHAFLEKKLNRKIQLHEEGEGPHRRIITSRPEYTIQGRARQEKLLKRTKIAGLVLGILVVGFIAVYQLVYKPYMGKNLIEEGVALIYSKEYMGDEKKAKSEYTSRLENFKLAEGKFKQAYDEYLDTDNVYGYHEFGKAYMKERYFDRSINKLNKIYSIYFHEQKKPVKLDTLNNLGEFYAKVSNVKFKEYKPSIKRWYYDRDTVKDAKDNNKLDLSIQFFKRVLARDKKNSRAMYGIGNSYYSQGMVRKARDYYKDLVKIDGKSVNGYAGLLNLYIEEDLYADVENIRSAVMENDLTTQLPSALLAKLASYYLDKRKTKDFNIRIDHGVQSERVKDDDDNTYPAVLMVLKALNERDPDYPPLFYQYARLHKIKKNYTHMRRYLEKAIEKQSNYYAALHMMGEYYYFTKQPVEAYQYFNKARKAYYDQPEFTRDMFYRETEKLGKTYLLLGNIFYYFQDPSSFRMGNLDDPDLDAEMDRLNNNDIAREKYLLAIKHGYTNSELKYNLGRIYYLKKLYRDALTQWNQMYGEYIENPQLRFALGNAYYHLGKYEVSKGEYLKLISVFENKAEKISAPIASSTMHVKIFKTLSSAYNNLGAVYRMQQDESKSGVAFWKAVDYAKRIERDNPLARVNLARSFGSKQTDSPMIDEDIPYSIDLFENIYEKNTENNQ